jgi:DNA-binding CsgD family transcriptional regulator
MKKEKIIELYNSNKTKFEIAKELGTTIKYIYQVLYKYGIKSKIERKNRVQEILSLKEYNVKQIAERLNLSEPYIKRVLWKHNIKWERAKRASKKDEIINMYNNGMERKEIATKIGKSLNYINSTLYSNSIKIWDKKRILKPKKAKKNKFFDLTEFKEHYFFNYNR